MPPTGFCSTHIARDPRMPPSLREIARALQVKLSNGRPLGRRHGTSLREDGTTK